MAAHLFLDAVHNALYIADQFNNRIRQVTTNTTPQPLTTAAGTTSGGFSGDGGPATSAQLNFPLGVTVDKKGDIIVADAGNNRVRTFKYGGNISTVAGNGTCGFSGDHGPATSAELCFPADVAINKKGLYIADEINVRIRKVDGSGKISTYAGTGAVGYNGDGLPALSTNLDDPVAVSFNPSGPCTWWTTKPCGCGKFIRKRRDFQPQRILKTSVTLW